MACLLPWPILPACGACFTLILLGGFLAGLVPPGWRGNWTPHIVALQTHAVDRFFAFDALWYERIARIGYEWNPAMPDSKQDIAFFPLWPAVLRVLGFFGGGDWTFVRWGAVAAAASSGLGSVAVFHALARRVMPGEGTARATWLFALYPGASFLLLSYPTGLMNLLCAGALLMLLDGRIWRAALLSGLLSVAGPLGLGTGMVVCVCAARRAWRAGADPRGATSSKPAPLPGTRGSDRLHPWRNRATAWVGGAACCLLAISGLAGFVAWQWAALKNPLAFVAAQRAWAEPLPWSARPWPMFAQMLVLPDVWAALRHAAHVPRAPTLVRAQAEFEMAANSAWLAMAVIGVAISARLRCWPVFLQGIFTLCLFLWFHSVSRPGNSTFRLTYCVLPAFFGLAMLLRGRPRAARCVLAIFAALLFWNAFAVAAGYHIV